MSVAVGNHALARALAVGRIGRRSVLLGAAAGLVAPGRVAPRSVDHPACDTVAEVARLQRAIDASAAAGAELRLEPRTYALDSAALGAEGLRLRTGVSIVGAATQLTRLEVTGRSPCNLFTATNEADVSLRALAARGNGVAFGSGLGFALFARQTGAAREAARRLSVRDCAFTDFAGDWWLYVLNDSDALAISGVSIKDNTFISRPGDSRDPSAIGVPSFAARLYGRAGPIEDAEIVGNTVKGAHIKGGFALYDQVVRTSISHNVIESVGLAASAADSGAYAILIYGESGEPSDITVAGNRIADPFSCGIYAARGNLLKLADNTISGQSDRADRELPKAAIAINGSSRVTVTGGTLSRNAFDIAVVGPYGHAPEAGHQISRVHTLGSRSASIYLRGSQTYPVWQGLAISDCVVAGRSRGIGVNVASDHALGKVDIRRCLIEAPIPIDPAMGGPGAPRPAIALEDSILRTLLRARSARGP